MNDGRNVVTGRMTVEVQDNGLFSCTTEFDGHPSHN